MTRKKPAKPKLGRSASARDRSARAARCVASPHRSRMPSSVHARSASSSSVSDMPAPSFAFRKSGRGGRIQSSTKPVHSSATRTLSRSPSSRPRQRCAMSRGDSSRHSPFGCNSPRVGRLVDRQIVAQRGEHVVHQPAAVVHVPRILRRHPRQARRLGELDQAGRERRLMAAGVVELYFYRKGSAVRTPRATGRAAERRRSPCRRGAGKRRRPSPARSARADPLACAAT